LRRRFFGALGWQVYLHRFVDSDPDLGLHDQPGGRVVSLVLSGAYREVCPCAGTLDQTCTRTLGPGRLNRLRGSDFRRVVLRPGRPAWTLFLQGPRVKGWG
jgi:hypothetical protein